MKETSIHTFYFCCFFKSDSGNSYITRMFENSCIFTNVTLDHRVESQAIVALIKNSKQLQELHLNGNLN